MDSKEARATTATNPIDLFASCGLKSSLTPYVWVRMPSAIATTTIFPGAAVAQTKDTASLAGGSILASHIVTSGAIKNGIVTMINTGIVTLNDWSLSTGGKQLTTGATYFVGLSGKISTSGSQPVGIAISPISLSVTIQSQSASSNTTTISPSVAAEIVSLQSQINALSSTTPKLYAGTFSIPNGVNSGTVTGLGITTFVPTRAIPIVRAQSGALNIFASVVDGTVSQDGFQFTLSSLTDSANYKLDFEMTP